MNIIVIGVKLSLLKDYEFDDDRARNTISISLNEMEIVTID